MNEVYTKALTEVDEIINHLDIATLEKIPISFRKFVKTTKNQDYRFEYKDELPLTEQGLSDEAKAIISLMYRNYMCSKEEKQRLAEKDKKALEIKRQKEQEKYNVDNIIKEKQKEMQGAKAQLPTVIKKEGFFRRILNSIRNFFKGGRKND